MSVYWFEITEKLYLNDDLKKLNGRCKSERLLSGEEMIMGTIKSKLLEFICRSYMVEENEFDHDKSLVDQGIIDSFGLIEISSFLKQEFGIIVHEEEMNRSNFGSVLKLVSFVETKLKQ